MKYSILNVETVRDLIGADGKVKKKQLEVAAKLSDSIFGDVIVNLDSCKIKRELMDKLSNVLLEIENTLNGEDTKYSSLEVKEDGTVKVNGETIIKSDLEEKAMSYTSFDKGLKMNEGVNTLDEKIKNKLDEIDAKYDEDLIKLVKRKVDEVALERKSILAENVARLLLNDLEH